MEMIKSNGVAIESYSALADNLSKFIKEKKLSSLIAGKEYVNVEGWQFAGAMFNVIPLVISTTNLSNGNEIKYEAQVHLIDLTNDKMVGSGIAICSNKEIKKKSFDEYAILSMAQTRAIGKAYRNRIGFLMKFAGFETTPYEEMESVNLEKDSNNDKPNAFIREIKYMSKEQSELVNVMIFKKKIKNQNFIDYMNNAYDLSLSEKNNVVVGFSKLDSSYYDIFKDYLDNL